MAVYNRRILLRRAGGALAAGMGGFLVLLGLRKETTVPATEAKKRRTKNPKKKGTRNGGSGHAGHATASADLVLKSGLKIPAREIAVERAPSGQRNGGTAEAYVAHNLLPFQVFGSLDELAKAAEQGARLGLFKLPKA